MKSSIILLSILFAGVLAHAIDPSVNLNSGIPNVLLKTNEAYAVDLNDYLVGYNLTFSSNNATVSSVAPPLNLTAVNPFSTGFVPGKAQVTSQTYPRNLFGSVDYDRYLLTVTDDAYLYWASIDNSTAAPSVRFGFQVTTSKLIHCYGAVQITSDIVVVDCSTVGQDSQTDQFYYVSIKQKKVINVQNNTATTNTTWNATTGRATRGVRVADFGNSLRYVFRYVGTDAITNPAYQNDSYIEIWNAYNPTNLKPVNIISRKSLGAGILNLTSFEVVNNTLVILCDCGAIFTVSNYHVNVAYNVTGNYRLTNLTGPLRLTAGLESGDDGTGLTVVVWGANSVFEIDWSTLSAPFVRQTYNLGSDLAIQRVDFTAGFLHAHVTGSSVGERLLTLRRHRPEVTGINQLHTDVPVNNSLLNIWWGVDRVNDNLYLWDVNISLVHTFHYLAPIITINATTSTNGNVTVTAISTNTAGSTKALNTPFTFTIINEFDFTIYVNSTASNLTVDYPSTHSIDIDGLASGPGVNYSIKDQNLSYSFQSFDNVSISVNTGDFTQGINFHHVADAPGSPGTWWWLIQAANNTLYRYDCSERVNPVTQKPSTSCNVSANVALGGPVTRLVVASNFVVLVSSDQSSNVLVYNAQLALVNNLTLGDALNACSDLTLSHTGTLLFCTQPLIKQITVWKANSLPNFEAKAINRTLLTANDVPIFSPVGVEISPSHPDYLFVNNKVGVLVLNLALFWSNNLTSVISEIKLPSDVLSSPFDLLVNANSILLFLTAGANTVLREYSLTADSLNPLFVKEYTKFYNYTYQLGTGSHFTTDFTDRFYTVVTDANSTTQILTLAAGAHGNNNYLFKIDDLSVFGRGRFLIAGVRSTITNADYVFASTPSGPVVTHIVYDHTTLTFNAFLNDNNSIVENNKINITASSTLQPSSIGQIPLNVQTYNTQPPLTPGTAGNDTNAVKVDLNKITSDSLVVFDPYAFINGTVTHWELVPEKKEDIPKFTLQTQVSQNASVFNSSFTLYDIVKTPTGKVYSQGANTIAVVVNNTLTALVDMTVPVISPAAQQCTNIYVDESNAPYFVFSTSFCADTVTNKGYLITVSYVSSSPSPLPPVETPFSQITEMRKVGDLLFILESGGNVLNPNGKLHYFNIANPTNITYAGFVSGADFGTNSFQVGGFDYLRLSANTLRFYFTDARFGIRTLELTGTTWSNPQEVALLSLPAFQKELIPNTAHFLGVRIVKNDTTGNNTWVALSTDTYKVYYVALHSKLSGLTADLLTSYGKLSAAVNNYKISSISVNGYTYFAVSSYNADSKTGSVTVYNATQQENNTAVAYTREVASLPFPSATEGSNAFVFLNENNTVKLWAYTTNPAPAPTPNSSNTTVNTTKTTLLALKDADSNNGSLAVYQVRPFFAIKINNPNITSTYLNLTGSNDRFSRTVSFKIIPPNPNPGPGPQPGPRGLKWWGILLIILAILIVIGAIFAFIRYRNKKKEELENSNDANAPLTTNYA